MLVQRRQRLEAIGQSMARGGHVVMPMGVRRAPTMAMGVDMSGEDSGITGKRGVERVAIKVILAVLLTALTVRMILAMSMSILGEPSREGLPPTIALYRDRDIEA